ncbi:MAG: AraC family transcriptional regulator [Cyanobacteria bacterium P01_A01_bin.70]
MAKVLTGSEVKEILQACRANGEVCDYATQTERFFELPSSLGQGYWRHIQLRPGLQLSISDLEKRQIHRHRIRQHPQTMPLTFSYYLSGGCRVENDGLKIAHEEVAGHSYLYCLPATAEVEQYPVGQRILHLTLRIQPDLLPVVSDRLHELPTELRTAIEQPEQAMLYSASRITPTQRQVLKQIFHCPYQGITRQFYLEAKALELLALQFDQMLSSPHAQSLAVNDIDRIYQAREILIREMTGPPSLTELARQVQLNERKLKEGFRQVFKTTVFGYLQTYRLQQARQLLQAGGTTVQATAHDVGYASRSSFVAAFKKQFGVTPSSCCQPSSQ